MTPHARCDTLASKSSASQPAPARQRLAGVVALPAHAFLGGAGNMDGPPADCVSTSKEATHAHKNDAGDPDLGHVGRIGAVAQGRP